MANDELKALCESNARSIEANSGIIAELARTMIAFRDEMRSLGADLRSWVETHNQISDDQGGELTDLRTADRAHDAQVTAIRDAANADRQAFREQAEADRQASRERADGDRQAFINQMNADRERSDQRFISLKQDSDQRFAAQQEVLQRMFLELRSTNGAVAGLSDLIGNLEAS